MWYSDSESVCGAGERSSWERAPASSDQSALELRRPRRAEQKTYLLTQPERYDDMRPECMRAMADKLKMEIDNSRKNTLPWWWVFAVGFWVVGELDHSREALNLIGRKKTTKSELFVVDFSCLPFSEV